MYRVGILGAAGIAPQAIIEPAHRRDDIEIHAVASSRPDAAAEYAERHSLARFYTSYDALLADPDIDIVYNALAPSGHAPWSIAALEAGKDVLCEKPSAMNAAEAQQMIDAAERTGRHLVEAFHYRYHPLFLYVQNLTTSGRLGRIHSLRSDMWNEFAFDPTSIRHDPAVGGGALMDFGCYPVHWMRTLMGEEPTVSEASAVKTPLGGDLTFQTTLAFPSGATAQIMATMGPGRGTKPGNNLIIEAEKGRVEIDGLAVPHRNHSIREWMTGEPYRVHTLAGDSTYDYQLDALIQALRTGRPALTEGADLVRNMSVIDDIYRAAGVTAHQLDSSLA